MKKMVRYFILSIVFLTVGSLSFLFMPLSSQNTSAEHRLPVIINGSVFWISFIIGYVALFLANRQCRQVEGAQLKGRIGLLCFFSNPYATVFDILMILSLVGFIIMIVLGKTHLYIMFVLLSILILSLNMHCILNGRVMKTIIYKNEERES